MARNNLWQRSGAGTIRTALVHGTGQAGVFTTASPNWEYAQRGLLRLPGHVIKARLRVRNCQVNPLVAYANAITVTGVYLGLPAFSTSPPWLGAMRCAPAQLLTSFSTPADGSEVVSNWITDRSILPRRNVEYAYSIGYQVPTSGTQLGQGSDMAGWLYGTSGSAIANLSSGAQVGAAHVPAGIGSPANTQLLDVRWEFVMSEMPQVTVIGDSIMHGTRNIFFNDGGCYPHTTAVGAAGLRHGFAVQNLAIGGSKAADFGPVDPQTDWRWQRIDWQTSPPDVVILQHSRNDINSGNNGSGTVYTVAQVQANVMAEMDDARQLAPRAKIFLCTEIPGAFFGNTGVTTVNGAGQTPTAGGTLIVVSTTGFSSLGAVNVPGIGDVAYTAKTGTTFTGCTGPAGTATNGGTVSQTNNAPVSSIEVKRQAFNAWTRSCPYGAAGVLDFDDAINPPGTPLASDGQVQGNALFTTNIVSPGVGGQGGDAHPNRAGHQAMAHKIPSFTH